MIDLKLPFDYDVIAFAANGREGFALIKRDLPVHKYVTYRFDPSTGVCVNGHYIADYDEACADYFDRRNALKTQY
jgi:hypothetical protein